MFSDIVMPKNNEAEFIEVAAKLGIKKLYFLYDFDGYNEEKIQLKLNEIKNKTVGIGVGFVVSRNNLDKSGKKPKFLFAKSSEKDRFFIESKKIKLIYGFEDLHKKDYLHQRASGLNHVMCELAKKNNVIVGFSYGSLLNKDSLETSLLIGRMSQNISLCRKYKVKTMIGCFSSSAFDLRAHHDVISLFKVFGMDGNIAKSSLVYNF